MQSIIIGGLLPALFVGLALTFLKMAGMHGIGAGSSMIIVGLGVCLAGLIAHVLGLSGFGSTKAMVLSLLVGIFWGIGTLLMLFAVSKLGLPMVVSASLAASNVVVVVMISLFILGENSSISLVKLIVGMIAILFGSILVTTA